MTDPQSPREGGEQPDPGPSTSSGRLWDQVPDAEPWRPAPGRSDDAWVGEPTQAVPPAQGRWETGPAPRRETIGREAPGRDQVMENLVGSRVERARAAAAGSGWELSVRPVDPEGRNQPDGMVVSQAPRPGTPMGTGSAVAVSVVSRRSFAQRHPGALAALAALAAVLLGGLAGWGVAAAADDDEVAADPTELETQLAELRTTNEQLTVELEALRTQNADLTAQLEQATGASAELTAQIEQLTAERDAAVAELQGAQATITTLEESLAAVDDTFAPTENLVGTQVSAAESYAENRDLELIVQETTTAPAEGAPVAPGTVVTQAPAPGVPVAPGSVIYVEVFADDDAERTG